MSLKVIMNAWRKASRNPAGREETHLVESIALEICDILVPSTLEGSNVYKHTVNQVQNQRGLLSAAAPKDAVLGGSP